jgi:hypothetical protein
VVKRVKPGERMVRDLHFRRCNIDALAVAYVAKHAGVSKRAVNLASTDQELTYQEWVKLASWLGVAV